MIQCKMVCFVWKMNFILYKLNVNLCDETVQEKNTLLSFATTKVTSIGQSDGFWPRFLHFLLLTSMHLHGYMQIHVHCTCRIGPNGGYNFPQFYSTIVGEFICQLLLKKNLRFEHTQTHIFFFISQQLLFQYFFVSCYKFIRHLFKSNEYI